MDESFDSAFDSWVDNPKPKAEPEDDEEDNELENLSDEELLKWLKALSEKDYSSKDDDNFMEELKDLAIKETKEEIKRRQSQRDYYEE